MKTVIFALVLFFAGSNAVFAQAAAAAAAGAGTTTGALFGITGLTTVGAVGIGVAAVASIAVLTNNDGDNNGATGTR